MIIELIVWGFVGLLIQISFEDRKVLQGAIIIAAMLSVAAGLLL